MGVLEGQVAIEEAALLALSHEYARGLDGRDPGIFLAVFSDAARVAVFNPADSPDPAQVFEGEDLARLPESIGSFSKTFHFIGNSAFEISGERATGEVYCIAHHFRKGGPGGTNYVMYIRYRDVYVRRASRWRIEERRVLVDWTEYRTTNRPGQ